jgi:hypothetical protein
VLISLILQPRDQFIHQLITLREESICAVFGRLFNLNIKFIAQAQRRYFARENEILDQNPEGIPKEYGLRTFIPPSLTDSVNIGDMLLQNVSLFSLSWALQPFASLPQ